MLSCSGLKIYMEVSMRQKFTWALVLVLVGGVLLLSGCSGIGSKPEKLEVNSLYSIVDDRTNFPSGSDQATATQSFIIGIDDPTRSDEVTSIVINDPSGGSWTIDDPSSLWDPGDSAFELWHLYKYSNLDAVNLGEYTIELATGVLGTDTFAFTVSSVAGAESGSIQSAQGTGGSSEILGLPTLESASFDSGNDTLSVDFSYTDSNVGDGFVWMYSSTDDSSPMGATDYINDKITMNSGQTNSVDFSLGSTTNEPQSIKLILYTEKSINASYTLCYRSWTSHHTLPYNAP
jgi:hypothetical protein